MRDRNKTCAFATYIEPNLYSDDKNSAYLNNMRGKKVHLANAKNFIVKTPSVNHSKDLV